MGARPPREACRDGRRNTDRELLGLRLHAGEAVLAGVDEAHDPLAGVFTAALALDDLDPRADLDALLRAVGETVERYEGVPVAVDLDLHVVAADFHDGSGH